jgi:hypothetical protein
MSVSAIGAEPAVMDAIQRASARSGVGFDYLLATARRESGLDCQAKSKTSSACGLYQFVSQTWLSTLKAHGADHGLGGYADDITRTAQGQYVVANPARQAEILALRKDPAVSAAMAADLTADNAKILSDRLGRLPTTGELYAAHVLGAAGAAKLITLAGTTPNAAAADHFADAASRNQGLFYDRAGAPVSAAALASRLTAGLRPAQTPTQVAGLRPSVGLDNEIGTANETPVLATATDPLPALSPAPSIRPFSPWQNGLSHQPQLTLTPQILSILSRLDPPGTDAKEHRSSRI